MYWAGADSPYKSSCGAVLSAIESGELKAVTDTEVFQEILHRYTSIRKMEIARQVFDDLYDMMDAVLPVTEDDIRLARQLHEIYDVRARDLVHVAVMLNAGITDICSVDSHFDQIGGIRRIDPRRYGAGG